MTRNRAMRYPNWTWENRAQFKEHFQLWCRRLKQAGQKVATLSDLRRVYELARDGYYPNPAL